MTEARPTDVEIYVQQLDRNTAEHWLGERLDHLKPMKKRKGMPKSAFLYEAQWQSNAFTLVIFEEVSPGFTSVWFDTTTLPWADDKACALEAVKAFDRNVRITAGGWHTEADPDAWLEVQPNGTMQEIIWKG